MRDYSFHKIMRMVENTWDLIDCNPGSFCTLEVYMSTSSSAIPVLILETKERIFKIHTSSKNPFSFCGGFKLSESHTRLYSSNQFSSSHAESQRSILSMMSLRLCASSLILFICISIFARSSEGSTNPERNMVKQKDIDKRVQNQKAQSLFLYQNLLVHLISQLKCLYQVECELFCKDPPTQTSVSSQVPSFC